jgi:copper resistance protein B
MIRRSNIIFATLFIAIVAFSSQSMAQKAPDFSNDIMMDNQTYVYLITDRLEYYGVEGPDPMVWDIQGWAGSNKNKFWFKSEGEALTIEKEGEMEFQGLYSLAITSYFDLQAGLRYDLMYKHEGSDSRFFGVLGFQGLAPYFFEVDGAVFISQDGDISTAVEGEYDMLFTQRLIGQPRFSTKFSVQDVPEFGVGSGFNQIQLGYRLRYEFRKEFAPYIGISWKRKLGDTADLTRLKGGDVSIFGLVGGLRMWF